MKYCCRKKITPGPGISGPGLSY